MAPFGLKPASNGPPCMLCGRQMKYTKSITHRRDTDYFWCEECDFAQLHPLPGPEELARYYSTDEYRMDTHGASDPGESNFHEERERARGWFPFLKHADTHLDIGSSTGMVLETTAAPLQVGVEPGPWGRAYGAHIDVADLVARYDLITCFHVLEHVLDPLLLLHQIRRLAKGQVAIEVPQPPGWGWPHITCFREKSLLDTMERAGLPAAIVENRYHIKALCELS